MALIAIMPFTAAAQAPSEAGTAVFVFGDASIDRNGSVIILQKGSGVSAGDVVLTGETGRVQLKMRDGARVAIKPNTRFAVDEYEVPEITRPASTGEPPATGKSINRLLQGGFRTITGVIGSDADVNDNNPTDENYQVKTPVATIGIRGTDYTAVLCLRSGNAVCGGECNVPSVDPFVGEAGNQLSAGTAWELYVGVNRGQVVVSNSTGSIQLGVDEFTCIANDNSQPQLLIQPPRGLRNRFAPPRSQTISQVGTQNNNQNNSQNTTQRGVESVNNPGAEQNLATRRSPIMGNNFQRNDETRSPLPRPRPLTPNDNPGDPLAPPNAPPDSTPQAGSFASGPLGNRVEQASVMLPNSEQVNGQGELVGFSGDYTPAGANMTQSADYTIGSATIVNVGGDNDSGLNWGRWAAGSDQQGAMQVTINGMTQDESLLDSSLHWVVGDGLTAQQAQSLSGTANYSLVGNTEPTDDQANVGPASAVTGSLAADFDNNIVTHQLGLSITGNTVQANGTGSIGTNQPGGIEGNYNSVVVNGQLDADAVGEFSGFFTPPAAAGAAPAGAGVSYSITSDGVGTVSGAAAFGDPQ